MLLFSNWCSFEPTYKIFWAVLYINTQLSLAFTFQLQYFLLLFCWTFFYLRQTWYARTCLQFSHLQLLLFNNGIRLVNFSCFTLCFYFDVLLPYMLKVILVWLLFPYDSFSLFIQQLQFIFFYFTWCWPIKLFYLVLVLIDAL